jgi:protein TIF31
VSALIQEAKSAMSSEMLEKAFEAYTQAANVLMQIQGALNHEVSMCLSKMANIQFRMGDNLQAIELLTKSIVIQEKLLGYDSPTVAYSYSNLGLYYHTCQYASKGFECMHRSLSILQISCGDNHPDIASIYLNLGLMYQDVDNYHAAVDCFKESLVRSTQLYGEESLPVAQCYSTIAHAYFLQRDFRMALENQEKCHEKFKKLLPENSPLVKQAFMKLDEFMHYSVQQEKIKKIELNQKGIGSGKRQFGQNTSKLSEQDKQDIIKRQRIEQYIKMMQEGKVNPELLAK